MNTYDIKSKDYLGVGEDAAHHPFHAFRIDQEIHIVYDLCQENQHVAKADVHKVSSKPDKYLWTPFAQFSLAELVKKSLIVSNKIMAIQGKYSL